MIHVCRLLVLYYSLVLGNERILLDEYVEVVLCNYFMSVTPL